MSWLSDSFAAGRSGHGLYGQGAARPGVAVIRAPPVPGRILTAPAGDAQARGPDLFRPQFVANQPDGSAQTPLTTDPALMTRLPGHLTAPESPSTACATAMPRSTL